MKVPFLPALIACIKKHKKPCALLLVLVVGLVGAFYGWKHYLFMQGPEKAVQNIALALQKGDRAQLAVLVDFRKLAEDFAHTVAQHYQGDKALPPVALVAENLQQCVLDALAKGGGDKNPGKPDPYAPLPPLPEDGLAQMATTLTLQQLDPHYALLQASVDYPRAERSFSLLFQMDRLAAGGWRISRIVNAAELVQNFMASEAHIRQQKAEALAEKNAEQEKRMQAQFTIHSCTALAGMLSDRKTALLTLEVTGYNPGPNAVFTLNIEARLLNKKTEAELGKVPLNLAKRTLPGEQFSNTWNISLDLENPVHRALLAEKDLQCSPRFKNMTLGTGEVLFVRKNLH